MSPRSCLRWKQTGRIFKTVGLRWVPTRKIFTSSTTTVDSEPPHGSNTDITNLHECIQTLDSSVGTSINVQEEQNLALSAYDPVSEHNFSISQEEGIDFDESLLHYSLEAGGVYVTQPDGSLRIRIIQTSVPSKESSNGLKQAPEPGG
ncbi:hypothetical protein Tco_0018561 [Tanacetum coccineum]